MKKKLQQSEEASPGQPPADYVVGQVSGSLSQKKSAASGSLSALFGTAAPAAPLLFQPAPKPVKKSTEQQAETPEVKGQPSQKKKKEKPLKEKSEAEQKLENREMSLQNADEAEGGQQAPRQSKNKKRKAPEAGGRNEQWVMKRQRMRAREEEEVIKRKRTVFVGNLPVSCTRRCRASSGIKDPSSPSGFALWSERIPPCPAK